MTSHGPSVGGRETTLLERRRADHVSGGRARLMLRRPRRCRHLRRRVTALAHRARGSSACSAKSLSATASHLVFLLPSQFYNAASVVALWRRRVLDDILQSVSRAVPSVVE